MTGLVFYNPSLRQKQAFCPRRDAHVTLHCPNDETLSEHNIKRLRQQTVLAMMSRWFTASGFQVCVQSTNPSDTVVVDVSLWTNKQQSPCANSHATHSLCIGEVFVPRKPNPGEDLYCSQSFLDIYGAEVLRFFLLRSQYRTSLQFTKLHIEDARRSLDLFYRALRAVPPAAVPLDLQQVHVRRFIEAMNDDFNMVKALTAMNELANTATAQKSATLSAQLKHLGQYLDILQGTPAAFLERTTTKLTPSTTKWSFLRQLDTTNLVCRKTA